ncbi:hypothetical protein A4A49_65046, partial [Nicotiana attenuata]
SQLFCFRPQDNKFFRFRKWGRQLLPFNRLLHFRQHHYQLLHFKPQDSKPLHFRPQHSQIHQFMLQHNNLFHFRPRDRQLLHFSRRHYQLHHFNLLLIPHHHKQHPISVLNVSLHIIEPSIE